MGVWGRSPQGFDFDFMPAGH
ncbi:MAG: hypothetical protein HW380_3202, partial [Magnetococcales bacterium]|nr:hypothetical protein [Magnetococcales bacterium]